MSSFLGSAGGDGGVIVMDERDGQMRPQWFQEQDNLRVTLLDEGFANAYWPGGGRDISDSGGVHTDMIAAIVWETPRYIMGSSGRWGVTGVTRDVFGSPLGSVVVKLFRTADDSLQSTATSDPITGAYLLTTPFYPDTHYVVARKVGSPDVQGVTVNTLIGG